MAPISTMRFSKPSSTELYQIFVLKYEDADEWSAYVQSFKNTQEKDRFEELTGIYTCNSANLLRGSIRIPTQSLGNVEIWSTAGMYNMDIETWVEICRLVETLKVSSLDVHIVDRPNLAGDQLHILRKPYGSLWNLMNHSENRVSNLLENLKN